MSNSHKKTKEGNLSPYIAMGVGIFVLVIFVGVIGFSSGDVSGEVSVGGAINEENISLEETFYDFGSISMAKGDVSRIFSMTNDSSRPVVVKKVFTSCMCTTAYLSAGGKRRGPFGMPGHGGAMTTTYQRIEPGETAEIEVIFDPKAHGPAGVGSISRVVTVETDSGSRVNFSFRANVTP